MGFTSRRPMARHSAGSPGPPSDRLQYQDLGGQTGGILERNEHLRKLRPGPPAAWETRAREMQHSCGCQFFGRCLREPRNPEVWEGDAVIYRS